MYLPHVLLIMRGRIKGRKNDSKRGFSRGARMRLRDMRRRVETDLRDLQKLLNRNPKTARAELAKLISKITLTPRAAMKYRGMARPARSNSTSRPRGCSSSTKNKHRDFSPRCFCDAQSYQQHTLDCSGGAPIIV